MGGFVYKSRNEGVYNIDVMHFDDFPEGVTPDGENPNLTLRSYLTSADGECIPMYEFIDDIDAWTKTLLNAENAAPGDGNILKFVGEFTADGKLYLSPGELLVENGKMLGFAPTDRVFEGVSYSEINAALIDAGINKHHEIEPKSPCDSYASNTTNPTMKTSI